VIEELGRKKGKTMREMDKLAKDRKGFSRWTEEVAGDLKRKCRVYVSAYRTGTVMGLCECDNELLGFIKCGEFL
jgi:hypothetical protein